MNPELLAGLEAILFASDAPVEVDRLAEVLEIDPTTAREAVEELRAASDRPGRGIAVVEVAGVAVGSIRYRARCSSRNHRRSREREGPFANCSQPRARRPRRRWMHCAR